MKFIFTCCFVLLIETADLPFSRGQVNAFEGEIRLLGGNETSGRVEIFLNGSWGTVCDDGWDLLDGHVVCRQLGFPGALRVFYFSYFGKGTGVIHLDETSCNGRENFLIDCPFEPQHDCTHGEDASVICRVNAFEGEIRFRGGNETSGRVEIFLNGSWGTVCDDGWDLLDGNVVCHQLGFSGALQVFDASYFGEGTGDIHLDETFCNGGENALIDCLYESQHDCTHRDDAGVICSANAYEGGLRLIGVDETSGRVEIFLNGRWGTVCDDGWDLVDGDVVCRQLGFPGALQVFGASYFGSGTGDIHLDEISCTGEETFLSECFHISHHDCTHLEDAGVICSVNANEGELRLRGGDEASGRVEIFLNGSWGTVCDDGWDLLDGDVVCRQLGFPGALQVFGDSYFGEGTGDIHLDDISCSGEETFLSECLHISRHNCAHSEDAGVICTVNAYEGELRLRGGGETSGRVEIFLNGRWGTVCDDGWDLLDGEVVCRQLGFFGALQVFGVSYFGEGAGAINVDETCCTGSEHRLIDCFYISNHDCIHLEDAGVSCSALPHDGEVRLQGGNITAGRVEVFLGGQWGSICDEMWDINDADVVCRQLGFRSAIDVVEGAFFDEGTNLVLLSDVSCNGTETSLVECPYTDGHSCGHLQNAGAFCRMYDEGSIRLTNGINNSSGRVEIFLNGAWGTVCDDWWDEVDANVACRDLGFDGALAAIPNAYFGVGSGNINLDNVECVGHETSLADCGHETVHNCKHIDDAGVVCIPEDEGQVRLLDGSDMFSGRVQIFLNETWSNVCGNQWDLDDARVVCTSLGYGDAVYFTHNLFPYGNIKYAEPFDLDGLGCDGTERSLARCPFRRGNCEQENHAGVVCQASELNNEEGLQLRLVNDFSNHDRFAGRVEVFFAGKWGTICATGWDLRDANVVCNQLGYGDAISEVTGAIFGIALGPIFLSNVDCRGDEETISDCVGAGIGTYDQSCDHSTYAGVQCVGQCLDFQCPEDVEALLSNSVDSIAVSWTEPSVDNNPCSAEVTVTRSHSPGDIFMEGLTVVTYLFEDTSENRASCNFTVTAIKEQEKTPDVPLVYLIIPSFAIVILLVTLGLIWTFRIPLARRFARRPLPARPGPLSVHSNPMYAPNKKEDNVSESGSVYDVIPECENAYYITPIADTKGNKNNGNTDDTYLKPSDKKTQKQDNQPNCVNENADKERPVTEEETKHNVTGPENGIPTTHGEVKEVSKGQISSKDNNENDLSSRKSSLSSTPSIDED